jgi:hypothetical protein
MKEQAGPIPAVTDRATRTFDVFTVIGRHIENRSQTMSLYIRSVLGGWALLSFLAGTVWADSAGEPRRPGWRDDFIARLEATALLQTTIGAEVR